MDANAVSLLAIFERKMRLEIPLFQRQYVWSQEQQWEPLWEDISRKFVEGIEGRQDAPVHFLGAMVLDQKQTPVTHVEKRQVIDGQQRLTTFQIFLAAFRDFCRENDCIDLAKECEGFTENKGMLADPAVDRFKVWPTLVDRTQFADVLTSGSKAELERRHPVVWRKYARKPEPRPRMVQAYLFFYDQLAEFFLGAAEEPPIGVDSPLSARLLECFQALKNSLRVVTIDLQQGDDAQVIFETLNARGEPLLPADLLRNYIFLRASRAGHDQETLYATYWNQFDDEFWRVEVKQGRLIRPRSDLFMQHFLASQIEEDIPVKHLFVEYRNWIERRHPFKDVEEELQTLAKHGQNFRRILEPTVGDPVCRLAMFLEAFDIRTAYPLLLLLLDSPLSTMEWDQITDVLESYLLRRSICGNNTKNYNRIFLQLTKNLRRNGLSAASLVQQLSQQSGDSAAWPNDAVFREAWTGNPAYDMGNAKLVHILGRLNSSYSNGWQEPLVFQQQPSVEHIMPQKWIDNWPLADGSKGMEFLEAHNAPDGDSRAASTENRDRMVQTFGNLTLLMQGLNSAQSNLGWDEKRPAMMANSLLPMNQDLNGVHHWDEDAIMARGEDLFARATAIWPDPATYSSRIRVAQAAE
ncbi:DUF262 domain-containing protein (plasmid) [Rhizobium sp. CB3171]|uniref:DUF262 domain-containing protein n=1 Tax=Rhizobium sp. CB3171 TaxID=3039157 RepID=UPI0024B1BF4D|nr:DUF262 domain-containing protein [Rhizobium sp. CB3171]WFU07386.1 DUF262 domain-containing protein [Rhizobium sp. CB3171]